jgi:hypothetical protein
MTLEEWSNLAQVIGAIAVVDACRADGRIG